MSQIDTKARETVEVNHSCGKENVMQGINCGKATVGSDLVGCRGWGRNKGQNDFGDWKDNDTFKQGVDWEGLGKSR